VVGIQASNPMVLGGAMDSPAADKAVRFIELCDAFHIPMVFLADVPGFLVGKKAEREGILRRGLRVGYVLAFASMPRVSVVLRKGYGQGSVAMCGHNMGQTIQLTWPSGEFGALPLEGGVNAAYRTKVEDKGELKEIQAQFDQYGSPFICAETFNFDDLIDPRDTRPLIIKTFRMARERNKLQLGPRYKHGIMP
jgi:acetyl-CoA carboxylase carboxyltransferase component